MCGIAGVFGPDASLTTMDVVRSMANSLVHRGPDDEGYFADQTAAFGFRRLAIIDRKNGRQPMRNEEGNVISICNGEIFNFRDLRDQLEKRQHRFKTECDAEILPHLYEEYGQGFVSHLRGQFAIALYDSQRRQLILARDHFGVCPLFYATVGSSLLFASEIKALLEHPGISKRVNLEGLDQILCFPGLVSPTTMFEGIRSLPGGQMLLVNEHGLVQQEYWDLEYPAIGDPVRDDGEQAQIDELEALLSQSVKDRLQSEVPVGLYLSGGLDSSLIAEMARRAAPGAQYSTFAVSFGKRPMCESRYQRLMAEKIGSRHYDISFDEVDVIARIQRTVYHAESPIRETYDTACQALSETASRKQVRVVLTGQGADELFAGYIGYRYDLHRLSRRSRQEVIDPVEREIRERLWGDGGIVYDNDYASLQQLKTRLYSQHVRDALPTFDVFRQSPVNQSRLANRHPIHQRSYLDLKLRLADHLLGDHGDRMSMAHTVEARHPFLDVSIADFVRTLPVEAKVNGWCEKYILKRLAAKMLPPEIVDREKFGWYAYSTPELLRRRVPWIEETLSPDRIRREGYFDPNFVTNLKKLYSTPGFKLRQPFERDLMALIISFNVFLEVFEMPTIN